MRPIQSERGVTIDTCYLCERKSTNEDDEAVLKKLLERDRKDPGKNDTEK